MNQSTLDYIRIHAADDVRRLALQGAPEGVDMHAALQQIEGRQLAARKLPLWATTDGLLFPPRLSLEQCSSEATAAYKRSLVERIMGGKGKVFVDLTAGFGVDFAALAPLFAKAVYVDRNPELCELAEHNFKVLGLTQAEVCCTTAEEALQQVEPGSFVMLDPARRDAAGRKVALIEDCTPDVCALQHNLRAICSYVLIKLSPMLDLTAALRALQGILEVHVVSVEGECKELLMVMRSPLPTSPKGEENPNSPKRESPLPTSPKGEENPKGCSQELKGFKNPKDLKDPKALKTPKALYPNIPLESATLAPLPLGGGREGAVPEGAVPIYCVDLPLRHAPFVFTRAEEAAAPLVLYNPCPSPSIGLSSPLGEAGRGPSQCGPSLYLYEPSASLLKAGAFRTICQRFPVKKLSAMSHLYVAAEPLEQFPGRAWRVVDGATFAKRDLRRLLAGISAAELSVRGFPVSVAALRRQLHLREGGEAHFVATTLADNTRVLLLVERLP